MHRPIINRATIAVSGVIPASGLFESSLQTLSFSPDAVRVRQIVYRHTAAAPEDLASCVFSDLVQGSLGAFYDGSSSVPNIIHPLRNFTQGTTWRYQIRTATGAIDTSRAGGTLIIHLEFIEYEKKPPATAPANIFK